MANSEQLAILKLGAAEWNAWRRGKNTDIDLEGADLNGIDLRAANLSDANLTRSTLECADLSGADLTRARLSKSFLVEANLSNAKLQDSFLSGADLVAATLIQTDFSDSILDAADFSWANLVGTSLRRTDLTLARFREPKIEGIDLTGATLDGTLFANCDLSSTVGLASCEHFGPSILDHVTLTKSKNLPISFLRGAGLPETLIEALPTILHSSMEYFSCFISYSHRDQAFASRLRFDLQQVGVRCWFAPHDLPVGGKLLEEISTAIRNRDKVLLILSVNSLASDWVEDEVTKAFEEEREQSRTILVPVRLDDEIMTARSGWAAKLRSRNIGDFRKWRTPKRYTEELDRVTRALKR